MTDVVVVGSFVQDLAFSTPRFPAPGETRIGSFLTGPGGKGFNQAVAARRQGADTLFIGAVGSDMFATQARQFAEREGLRCGFETIGNAPSGAASIVVNEQAENLIVVALGANDHLSVRHVETFASEIAQCRVLVGQFENALPATARALALAHAGGATTILNPAPINDKLDRSLLDNVDVLVPNETEFAFLHARLLKRTLADEYWTAPEPELHELCQALDVPTVIITLGARGCFVSQRGDVARHPARRPFYMVPPANVQPRDTTGAGDAFCGGLAAGIARFGPGQLSMACQFATQVAGLSTEKPGTAPAMPRADELHARFGSS